MLPLVGDVLEAGAAEKAEQLLEQAAGAGHPEAITELGRQALAGGHTKVAVELLQQAADRGDPAAHTTLGEVFAVGPDGAEPNMTTAMQHLRTAASTAFPNTAAR